MNFLSFFPINSFLSSEMLYLSAIALVSGYQPTKQLAVLYLDSVLQTRLPLPRGASPVCNRIATETLPLYILQTLHPHWLLVAYDINTLNTCTFQSICRIKVTGSFQCPLDMHAVVTSFAWRASSVCFLRYKFSIRDKIDVFDNEFDNE